MTYLAMTIMITFCSLSYPVYASEHIFLTNVSRMNEPIVGYHGKALIPTNIYLAAKSPDVIESLLRGAVGGLFFGLLGLAYRSVTKKYDPKNPVPIDPGNAFVLAAESGDLSKVTYYLRVVPSVDVADKDGGTALIAAVCASGDVALTATQRATYHEIVSVLLSAGAHSNIADKFGKTAFDYATRDRNEPILELLKGRSEGNAPNL